MDDAEEKGASLGEALYAAMAVDRLWFLLVHKGLITSEEAKEALDQALYVLERSDAKTSKVFGLKATQHVRTRLESMVEHLSMLK